MPIVLHPAPSRRYQRSRLIGGGVPPIPDITDMQLCYSLFGIAPSFQQGTGGTQILQTSDSTVEIYGLATSPFALDWVSLCQDGATPEATRFYNQGALSGTIPRSEAYDPAKPSGLVFSYPNITVAGAGSGKVNGTFSHRGVVNQRPKYNIIGQPDSETELALVYDWNWRMYDDVGATMYSGTGVNGYTPETEVYQKEDGALPVPTVTSAPLVPGSVVMNGTTSFGFTSSSNNSSTSQITIYMLFRTPSVVPSDRALFQTKYTDNYLTLAEEFAVYFDSSQRLVVSQKGDTSADENSKRFAGLTANTTYILTVILDRDTATVLEQTKLWLNNSDAGISQPESDDVSGVSFSNNSIGFFVGDIGTTLRPTEGEFAHWSLHYGAHDEATRTAWYNRLNYMKEQMGW